MVFGGVPGTSKTPIAHYLSCEFGLPIFSTDQIRYEVREDLRISDINIPGGVEEFEKRQRSRYERLISSKKSFIFDGSMDRKWAERKSHFTRAGYDCFLINIELTKPFLVKLFAETGRASWADDHLDNYLEQHRNFLAEFKSEINVQIDDSSFADRLEIAAEGLRNFLELRGS